ncbi:MAG: hypothetical protein ACI81L_000728 [Verrucomicrobiales bacterium]|jgi:hypothetical protein
MRLVANIAPIFSVDRCRDLMISKPLFVAIGRLGATRDQNRCGENFSYIEEDFNDIHVKTSSWRSHIRTYGVHIMWE